MNNVRFLLGWAWPNLELWEYFFQVAKFWHFLLGVGQLYCHGIVLPPAGWIFLQLGHGMIGQHLAGHQSHHPAWHMVHHPEGHLAHQAISLILRQAIWWVSMYLWGDTASIFLFSGALTCSPFKGEQVSLFSSLEIVTRTFNLIENCRQQCYCD